MILTPGRGLDAFTFLAAGGVQTSFGAFVPAYLAGHAWTQAQIGVALTAQTVASMLLQVPGGALVDAAWRIASCWFSPCSGSAAGRCCWPLRPIRRR